eukprot:jgi/Orpsp1_1/1181506/evm.model.c7180000077429.2
MNWNYFFFFFLEKKIKPSDYDDYKILIIFAIEENTSNEIVEFLNIYKNNEISFSSKDIRN